MEHEPGIWDIPNPEAEAAADARAQADVDAGRVVPHERVRVWLKALSEGRVTPPPRWDD